jgi:hypothetical protein
MDKDFKLVLKWSISTRIITILLAMISGSLFKRYDTSSEAYLSNSKGALHSFASWDALYFIDITKFGYDLEQKFAFFPTFPSLIAIFYQGNSFLTNLLI